MKKILSLLLVFLISTVSVYSADMRFIQVDGAYYTASDEVSIDKFDNIIKDINKQKNVEFVIFTGNNISRPDKKYLEAFLKSANKLNMPYYLVLGNKDVNKQKDLSKEEYMKIVSKNVKAHKKILSPNYVINKKDIVYIIVDGSKDVIPSSMGYYKSETLEWLENELKLFKNKNVVIIQHFPLIPPSKRESHYTFKPEEYLKLISNYSNVKAVISGHFNIDNEIVYKGVLHISTSQAPQYKIIDIIDYDSSEPIFWSTIKQ